MMEYMEQLKQASLFEGIEPQELERLLHCLDITPKTFQKGDIILQAGEPAEWFYLLLCGKVDLCRPDKPDPYNIVEHIAPLSLFAVLLACAQAQSNPISAIAMEDCVVLPLKAQKVMTSCSLCCVSHTRLTLNLVKQLACKGLAFRCKTEVLSQRTLREKIMAYLIVAGEGVSSFRISLNRSQLADYLCVDRSALSRELCRMRESGLLTFHKNHFTLLVPCGGLATERSFANFGIADGQVAAAHSC